MKFEIFCTIFSVFSQSQSDSATFHTGHITSQSLEKPSSPSFFFTNNFPTKKRANVVLEDIEFPFFCEANCEKKSERRRKLCAKKKNDKKERKVK
jgi:hypothetical protein